MCFWNEAIKMSNVEYIGDRLPEPPTDADASSRSVLKAVDRPALRLGQLLLKRGLITPDQLKEVLARQKLSGDRIGTCLLSMGLIPDQTLAEILAEQNRVPCVNLSAVEPEPAAAELITKKLALQCQAIPIARRGALLEVAILDPANVSALDELKFATGLTVKPFVAPESQIRMAIQKCYEKEQVDEFSIPEFLDSDHDDSAVEVLDSGTEILDATALESMSGDDRVIHMVNYIFVDAVTKKASDIHVEPYDRHLRVRFRIDGELVTALTLPWKVREALCSRMKIMASLNITERRIPQDGRIRMHMKLSEEGVKEMDFRVSTLPTLFGEKIVMRIMDKNNLMFDMRDLGFEEQSFAQFQKAIAEPYGLILVTGPTGSGKTNTLYSAISQLNEPGANIMAAEDPVEYSMRGVNQVQINERVGLTFAAALRSFLRQDPDVVLIGEMRDRETAEMAIKAALTGHLVLSTLHTNSAPAAVDRLANMEIEPFLVASSLQLICAQRLVRRLCSACKRPTHISPEALRHAGFREDELESVQPQKGDGCDTCRGSGYKGRVGLYEVMAMNDEIRETITLRKPLRELRAAARRNGMITLRESGLQKVRDGVTSLEQVLEETSL